MKQNWYEQKIELVLESLHSSTGGLTDDVVVANQNIYGLNKLPEQKTDSLLLIFLHQFTSPLVYILLAVSVVVYLLGEVTDSIVIAAVLFLNAIIGTVQEGRAQNTLLALKRFVQTTTLVRRSGIEIIIPDTSLVPGDVVILHEGDKVPADGRVLTSRGLTVSEASLTGESEPISKIAEFESGFDRQRNMLFKATHVVSGHGEMVVSATGLVTEIGIFSPELAIEGVSDIPLHKNIRALSRAIMVVVLGISVGLFLIGLLLGEPLVEMVEVVVSLAVSIIPEGLPVVMTLVLANGVWRMSQRKALVKKLTAVEALGQADIIAVDKTGTITKNELVVETVVVRGKTFTVKGSGYEPKGEILAGQAIVSPLDIPELVLAGKIASFAVAELVFDPEVSVWQISGDPTEAALLVFAEKVGFKPEDMKSRHPMIQDAPFNYEQKFHGFVYKDNDKRVLAVVGAPESIAKICHIPLTEMHNKVTPLVGDGLRVVAFAFGEIQGDLNISDLPKLTFGGLYGMRDALHPEVPTAVNAVLAGGIRVIMITGDHRLTAQAIAKKANIFKPGDQVITGDQLEMMTDKQLSEQLEIVNVFARVTPYHKLRIVQLLKTSGHIVAMTGDGVNDVPSLAAADLGIAMGVSGTEVTKESADIILLDDNFATIASAIEEGRSIYKTISRVLLYLFSTGIGELMTIALALLVGWPLPVVAVQILWLNFVTDGFLTVSFAMEPSTDQLFKVGRFQTHKYLVSQAMLWRMIMMGAIMTLSTLGLFYFYKDGDYLKATTIALTVLAVLQWINAWNCRSEKNSALKDLIANPFLIGSTILVIILQILAIYNPFFQKLLKTTALDIHEWLIILAISLPLLFIEEIRKFFSRKKV